MKDLEIEGDISFRKTGGQGKLEERAVKLLEAIRHQGSINNAAKAVGVSYKTAWDTLNRANNLAGEPLVSKVVGGAGGGCTTLTKAGHRLIRQYYIIKEEYAKYLNALASRIDNADQVVTYLRRMSMRISARNVLAGTVKEIRDGKVSSEVNLTLPGGEIISAVITPQSVSDLGLEPGTHAYAIIKSNTILIGTDIDRTKISARNVLTGKIIRYTEGAVNAELILELAKDMTLCAVITLESAKSLDLKEGMTVSAIFKASSVILGVL